jgi:hypothetical protein
LHPATRRHLFGFILPLPAAEDSGEVTMAATRVGGVG